MKNTLKIALTMVALICATLSYSPSAQAGAYTLLGGAAASTNYLAAGAANTYAIATDSSGVYTNGILVGSGTGGTATMFSAINAKDIDIQMTALCGNTSTTNVVIAATFYASTDSFGWTNGLVTNYITIPASTSANVQLSGLTHTTGCYEFYSLRSIQAIPAFGSTIITCTNINVKCFTKNGI